MNNTITWLLVADASKARLFSMHKARVFQQQSPSELELVAEYLHADSRKKGAELATDRWGEFGSGTFVENTSPKVHEAEQFAHELLGHLESARKEGCYRDLIIIAPPTFMGLLHKHMPHEIYKLVSQKIEKDYTQNNVKELMQKLIPHL